MQTSASRKHVQESDSVLAQATTENFPVAPRWIPTKVRKRLMDIYGYARLVDDIGDEAPGNRNELLDQVQADVERVYSATPELDLLVSLQTTVRDCSIPIEPLMALIEANRVDQEVKRYATFDDLLTYCTLSANPVGHLVLYVFDSYSNARAELSDRICSALQVIEHVQDVREDFSRGRIYMPQADLDFAGVAEEDLGGTSASAEIRHLLALETTRAEKMLRSGSPLAGALRGWARVSVAGFVGGGFAQIDALRRAGHDVLGRSVKAGKAAVVARSARVAIKGRA